MVLDKEKMYALGFALNQSGWLKEPVKELNLNLLQQIANDLQGVKFNFTNNVRWDDNNNDYIIDADYIFVYLKRGEEIRHANVKKEYKTKKKEVKNMIKIDIRRLDEIQTQPRTNQSDYLHIEKEDLIANRVIYLSRKKEYQLFCLSGGRANATVKQLNGLGYSNVTSGGGIN